MSDVYESIIIIDKNYRVDMPLLIHVAQHGSYPYKYEIDKNLKKAKLTLTYKLEYIEE